MGKNFSHTLGCHFLFAALTKYFFVLMFASGHNCTIPRDILTANNTSHNFQLLTTTTQKPEGQITLFCNVLNGIILEKALTQAKYMEKIVSKKFKQKRRNICALRYVRFFKKQ